MNLAFFSRFSKHRKVNSVFQILSQMRRHPVFRWARFDVYTPTLHPKKLILLLGQVHTVWKGKIGNRERRKIVNCQARLCSYYAYLEQFHQVRQFGGEGIYDGLESRFYDQVSFALYQEMEEKLGFHRPVLLDQITAVAKKILKELGEEWHKVLLDQRDLSRIQRLSAAVSGQTLFNFLSEGRVRVYPIEGEGAYQHVLQGISQLGARISKLENTSEFRMVRQRGGKSKSVKESEVILQYNALVKEFNQVIGSDLRERATMEILRKKAEEDSLVVFTMGVGHRKNYLRLVDEYLRGSGVAFVFVTAPELRVSWWIVIVVPMVILGGLMFLGWWL
ncbi:MAG: hypothetical protein Q8O95_06175 [bacterium]|nr:hypothetical protein [bacterium]